MEGKANLGEDTKSPNGLSGECSLPVVEEGPELKSIGEILLVVDSSAEGHSAGRALSWGGKKAKSYHG